MIMTLLLPPTALIREQKEFPALFLGNLHDLRLDSQLRHH
jgi:hypothetical protein